VDWLQKTQLSYRQASAFRSKLMPEPARVCEETEPGTSEREARLTAVLGPWQKFPETGTVVRLFFERYERLKNWMPGG
jgi:hypothetical protein